MVKPSSNLGVEGENVFCSLKGQFSVFRLLFKIETWIILRKLLEKKMTVKNPRLYSNVWSEGSRKKLSKQYKAWNCRFFFLLFVCTCVYSMSFLPFYHNQNSDYNDTSAVCIYVKKIFPGNFKTMKITNKAPKETVHF